MHELAAYLLPVVADPDALAAAMEAAARSVALRELPPAAGQEDEAP
jgi:hypothetical protein